LMLDESFFPFKSLPGMVIGLAINNRNFRFESYRIANLFLIQRRAGIYN